MPPSRSRLVKKEESTDHFLAFDEDIDWSQVSETQFESQLGTQIEIQSQSQSQTQVETQTTHIRKPCPTKLAHSPASPPVRTISVESGNSTLTNDSAKTLVVDDEDVGYGALLEGAENIDWDDWGTDEENNGITTPGKLKSPSKFKRFTPVKPKNLGGIAGGSRTLATTLPPYTKPCTRCIVVNTTRHDNLDDPVQVSGFSCSPSLLFSFSQGVVQALSRMPCYLMPGLRFPIFCRGCHPRDLGPVAPRDYLSYRVAPFSRLWLIKLLRKS